MLLCFVTPSVLLEHLNCVSITYFITILSFPHHFIEVQLSWKKLYAFKCEIWWTWYTCIILKILWSHHSEPRYPPKSLFLSFCVVFLPFPFYPTTSKQPPICFLSPWISFHLPEFSISRIMQHLDALSDFYFFDFVLLCFSYSSSTQLRMTLNLPSSYACCYLPWCSNKIPDHTLCDINYLPEKVYSLVQ